MRTSTESTFGPRVANIGATIYFGAPGLRVIPGTIAVVGPTTVDKLILTDPEAEPPIVSAPASDENGWPYDNLASDAGELREGFWMWPPFGV